MSSARFVIALALLAAPLAAQQPTAKPARPPRRAAAPAAVQTDTTKRDTTTVKDSLQRFVESFNYRNLGPAAYSGRVTAIAVPPGQGPRPKNIYIGAAGGGIWKTSNGGITWRSVGDGLGMQAIGDIAVAPSDSNVVWAGTGERNSLRSEWWGDGVYKSTNKGGSWTNMGLKQTREIGRIAIDPKNPDVVYVAALGHLWGAGPDRGIYKTTDGGKTWAKVLFVDDTTGFVDLKIDPTDPNVLYAAAWHRLRWGGSHMEGVGKGSGIYKSTDAGATWKRLTDPALKNGLPTDAMGRISLAVSPQNHNLLYAMIQVDKGVTESSQGRWGGVFRSSDGGATWTQVNDLQAVPHYYYDEVILDPSDTNHVFLLFSPVLESKDGGKTFAPDSLARVHVDNHAMWIDPQDPDHWLLGNDGGVYLTRDRGRSWEHQQIPIGQFYTVIVDSAHTPYFLCGGLQDNGVWCGPSATRDRTGITDADWFPVNGGDGMWVQMPPHDPWTVYSGWQFGNFSRLDLRTWKQEPIQPQSLDAGHDSGYEYNWGWTTPLLISQFDSTTIYAGGNKLFKLTHRGNDWQELGPDMTRANRQNPAPEVGSTSYHAIFSISESPRSANILWTGTDDGYVWVTQDGGKTWANVTANFPRGAPTQCWVGAVVASRFADGSAYVVYDCHMRDDYQPHVWRTADFGHSWTEIGQGLPADAGSLTMYESGRTAKVLFVGNVIGAYVTMNGGGRWLRLGKGLPNVPVEQIAMSYAQRDLVVATHGRGLWILPAGPLEELSDSTLGEAAHLFGVSPAYQYREADTYPSFGSRPFTASNPPRGAVITYTLKDVQPDGVKFVITSAAGDTVRTLTGPGYTGVQRVTWDLNRDKPRPRELGGPTSPQELRRVAPGDYIVHMSVGRVKAEQKFTVSDWPMDPQGRLR